MQLPTAITAAEADEMIEMSRWTLRGVRGLFIDRTGFELYRLHQPAEEQNSAE